MSSFFTKPILKSLSRALGKPVDASLLEVPPGASLGDYAFPCFTLAKELKKNPVEIAKELAGKIKAGKHFDGVKAAGPYVNFFVNQEKLAEIVLTSLFREKENYGKGKPKKRTILLEGWQPNTHKAFHIGHIRNSLVGECISSLLEFYGYKVIRVSYIGDVGAHIAKWIWYYTSFYRGGVPSANVGVWAGQIYSKATLKSSEKEFYKDEIDAIHKRLEEGDKDLVSLWKKTRKLCLDDFKSIYKELGSKIERWYFESEVEQPGVVKVKGMVRKGYAKYSDDAIIFDLEKYNLGVFVLLKSNGASLYSTKDIALAYLKSKEYRFDDSLYVVASEQDHHFRQLFKTLELIGYKDYKKLNHVSYGMVKLKEGKMSSRLGNIILYEEFRDKLMSKVKDLLKRREIPLESKNTIVKSVAFGAMKFTMLSQDSVKEIVFDYDQALSFEGETGPYVQYTHTRCASILRKSISDLRGVVDFSLLDTSGDKLLLTLLERFPRVIEEAALGYKPHLLTRYLLDLSQAFNQYYHLHPILKSDAKVMKARLCLVSSVKQVLATGLRLLGVEALEEM